jgi:ABC-2 type transport system ATP-binding protein
MAALLELGAGFHPDLTGRENIYLNGSILGFTHAEIDTIFTEIVEFAELEQFIDNQVKYYSSGMYARLGFAVAVNVDPEVLLIDEVLSVGDEAFQRKCMDRIQQFQRDGRTILLVTHAPDLVRQICDQVAVLDHGTLVTFGDPADAVRIYRDTLAERGQAIPEELARGPHASRSGVTINYVQVRHPSTAPYVTVDERLTIGVGVEAAAPIDDLVIALSIFDQNGIHVHGTSTAALGVDVTPVNGKVEIRFDLDSVPLLDGVYDVSVGAHTSDGGLLYDQVDNVTRFDVQSGSRAQGVVALPITVSVIRDAAQLPT